MVEGEDDVRARGDGVSDQLLLDANDADGRPGPATGAGDVEHETIAASTRTIVRLVHGRDHEGFLRHGSRDT